MSKFYTTTTTPQPTNLMSDIIIYIWFKFMARQFAQWSPMLGRATFTHTYSSASQVFVASGTFFLKSQDQDNTKNVLHFALNDGIFNFRRPNNRKQLTTSASEVKLETIRQQQQQTFNKTFNLITKSIDIAIAHAHCLSICGHGGIWMVRCDGINYLVSFAFSSHPEMISQRRDAI